MLATTSSSLLNGRKFNSYTDGKHFKGSDFKAFEVWLGSTTVCGVVTGCEGWQLAHEQHCHLDDRKRLNPSCSAPQLQGVLEHSTCSRSGRPVLRERTCWSHARGGSFTSLWFVATRYLMESSLGLQHGTVAEFDSRSHEEVCSQLDSSEPN